MNRNDTYTKTNNLKLETQIDFELSFVTQLISDYYAKDLVSIWLIGGYGRGEGGCEKVGLRVIPKNNYDLLVVLNRKIVTSKMRTELIGKINQLTAKYLSVPLEVSLKTKGDIRKAKNIMIFKDILNSSKTLLGPRPEELFTLSKNEDLPQNESLKIIRNRGMLLMASEGGFSHYGYNASSIQKKIWKAKAVIGYVDAILIIKNKYRTSYEEKNSVFQTLDTLEFLNPHEEYLLRMAMSQSTHFRLYNDPIDETFFGSDLLLILKKVHDYVLKKNQLKIPSQLVELALFLKSEGALRTLRNIICNLRNAGMKMGLFLLIHPRDQLNYIVPYLFYKEPVPFVLKSKLAHLSNQEKAIAAYIRYLV